MQKHIASMHKAEHEVVIAEKEERKKRKAEKNSIEEKKPKKIKPIQVKLDLDEVKDGCVNMVAVNGRPFSALDDSGFRQILDPIIAAIDPSKFEN